MNEFVPIYFSDAISDVATSAGNPLYKEVELKWSEPKLWKKGTKKPEFDDSLPFLYALIRNHGNSRTIDRIEYIGLTAAPKTRFGKHGTALDIVKQRGSVQFSYAPINFIRGKNRIQRIGKALQEIEHIFIWTVYEHLWNKNKHYTVPGMGKNRGNAWHIKNSGYEFAGRMPSEIVYPWIIVRHRDDRTVKQA